MTVNLAVLVEQMLVALDAIAEAVVFCNADNQVQWCNAAFEQLVNLTSNSIIGHNLTKVLPLRKAGKKVAPASYPSIKVLRGSYEITEYEWQREQRDELRLQISGSCVVAGGDRTCVLTIRNVTEATENKRTAAALKASETKFRAIVENANDIFVLIDPATGKLCYISPKVSDLLGYPLEEIEGQSFEPFVHPDDLSKCHEAFQRVITTGEKQLGVEHRVRHKNGSWRWHLLNASTLRDDEGNLLILGTGWDITDRKLAEAALRESEFKFRSIVENANDLLFIVKPNGIVSYLSPNVFNVMGYEPDEMIGKYLPALHPDDEQKCLDAFNQVLITGEKYSGLEYRVRYKDGTWAWHISNFGATEDTNGEKVIVGVGRDISEQQAALRDRKQAEEALKASEAKLNMILSSALGAVSHYRNYSNRTWEVEYHSPGCVWIWGYTAEELMADQYLFTSRFHPDDLQEIYRNAYDYIFDERSYEFEYRYFHPDGSLRWIAMTLTSTRDDAADCWRTTVISIDITDKKRAEEALKVSENRLTTILNRSLATIYRVRIYDDGEWEFEYCSPASIQLWGYAPETLIADKNIFVSRMVPEDLAEVYQQALVAVFAGETYEGEYRYNHPDGSLRWITFSVSPERDEAADCWMGTIIATDITDKKRAEAALVASETRLNAILNNAVAAILRARIYADREWEYEYCSPASLEILGYSPEEIVADKNIYLSRIVPEDLEALYQEVFDLIFNEKNYEAEYRYHHPDGSLRWISFRQTSKRDDVESCWITTIIHTDITAKKQAEAALIASETRLNTILDSTQAAIYRIRLYADGEWEFEYCSPGCLQLWGYAPEALMADKNLFVSRMMPEDFQTMYQESIEAVLTETTYECEYRYHHPDGSWRWFASSLSPERDEAANSWICTCISTDITARKFAEAALAESEERYRQIIETAQEGIWEIDANGITTFVNPKMAELLGYTVAETIGQSIFNFMDEEYIAIASQYLDRRRQGIEEQHDFKFRRKDGSFLWAIVSCNPLQNEKGEFIGALATITDITQRIQAEAALRISEARIRALYESISSAIILGSPNGIVDCNSAAEQLFMCSREEMIGKHVSVFSSPLQPNGENSYTLANQMIAIALKKGNHRFEWIHRRADGVDFPAEVCLTAVEVGANKFVQAIVQDLSDRKQAEAALAQRASLAAFRADVGSALGMSDSLLMMLNRCVKAAVKHLNISCARIWTLNPALNIFELQANAGCDTRGNGGSDSAKRIAQRANRIHFNKFPAQVGKNNAILKNKSIVNPHWVRRENIIAAASFPLTLEAETLGMLVIFANSELNESTLEALEFAVREIALGIKRKQAEAALKVAKEAAENASKSKSIFLANMSHELRTPLNAILGFSQLMERDPAITSRQRESLGIINRSGEHLLTLIDDVLEMSKIEAGRIVLNPVAFNLHLLLKSLQEMFQIRTQSKQLFLEFDIAADLPQFVVTDEGKLRQVLINLLGNAVKFTNSGGITLRASVNSSELSLNPQLFFAIEDTGKGIASEEMERLFQPFVQTESGIQSKEGTGLGLTISRQYVQLMGGNIDCHSVLGQGSVFSFNLPVKLAQSGEMIAQTTTKGRVIQIAPNQPSYRILVVDDRQENCELLLQLLQTVGFEIKTAANGEEAIAIWQQWHPHLIFMDMRMPLMDGYEATRQICSIEAKLLSNQLPITNYQLPITKTIIIALTASAFEEQQANVLAAGCDDFVRKPFREQVIFDKLAQYLGVEYIYEEPPAQNLPSPVNSQITQLDSIEEMPPEWIAKLYQAAIAVDASLILQLIAELPPERGNLAQELNSLLHNFCFDEIIEMIEMANG